MSKSENLNSDRRINLTGKWQFRISGNYKDNNSDIINGLENWMEAYVPGTVHIDLMTLGIIPDPFYRDNELHVQWVSQNDWEYRKIFDAEEEFIKSERIDLVCEGLDTFARIFLNDIEVGSSQNMFVPHRFEVQKTLCRGQNEIRIQFDSPVKRAVSLERKFGKLFSARHSERVYVRKAQYSFGWDWGPSLPSIGIWRPIYLEKVNRLRISDVFVKIVSLTEDSAQIEIEIEVEKVMFGEYKYLVEMKGKKKIFSSEVVTSNNVFTCIVNIPDPSLWWPNGYGEPVCYDLKVKAFDDKILIDERDLKFGIREVRLRQKNEEGNPCFFFEVNGVPIFCKGANWIPADSFLSRVTREMYDKLLNMAKNVHMNIIRVWGGGIYENPVFYQKCDELGIMVWQDFMFACAGYPEKEWFINSVSEEISTVIRRLRNHPSIVLWCGNNENEWIWKRETGKRVEEMPGYKIYHEIMPKICKDLDPYRPFWPTSPWGGEDPNSSEIGNRHVWNVWSEWTDFTEVIEDKSLFITEFGFQAPASLNTMEACLAPNDQVSQSSVFEFHNKQNEGTERLFRFLAGHQKVSTDFKSFIYACQVNQAEALKFCIEHWRRRKFETGGTLIWQLNDCWPAISWSLIDERFYAKASYYYARQFYNDVLVILIKEKNDLVSYIVNDLMKNIKGKLEIIIKGFYGEQFLSKIIDINVVSNGVTNVVAFTNDELLKVPKDSVYIHAIFGWGKGNLTENSFFFDRYKFLNLPESTIDVHILSIKGSKVDLELKSSCFLKSLYFYLNGWDFEDNFFDLHPNVVKHISGQVFSSSIEELKNMVYYSVGHYIPQRVNLVE